MRLAEPWEVEAMQQPQFRQLDYLNQCGREIKLKEAAEIGWEQKELGRVGILELVSLSWGVLGQPEALGALGPPCLGLPVTVRVAEHVCGSE